MKNNQEVLLLLLLIICSLSNMTSGWAFAVRDTWSAPLAYISGMDVDEKSTTDKPQSTASPSKETPSVEEKESHNGNDKSAISEGYHQQQIESDDEAIPLTEQVMERETEPINRTKAVSAAVHQDPPPPPRNCGTSSKKMKWHL